MGSLVAKNHDSDPINESKKQPVAHSVSTIIDDETFIVLNVKTNQSTTEEFHGQTT